MPTADLSLNLATVSRQWKLREAVAAAARHGFAGVAPWRDMVTEIGTAEAAGGRNGGLLPFEVESDPVILHFQHKFIIR